MERRKVLKIFLFQTLVFALMVHLLDALHVSPPKMVLQPPNTEIIHLIGDNLNGNDKPLELKCKAESEIEMPVERAIVNQADDISFSWIYSNDSKNQLKFSNNILDIKYRWMKDGKPFDWSANNRVELRLGEGTLIINNPNEEDNGQYQCFAQNDYGVASSNSVFVRVFTLSPPTEVKPEKETVNVTEGHPARLECKAPAKWPKSFVFWVFTDEPEENVMTFEKINGMEKLGKDTWSESLTLDRHGNLYFSDVSTDDASANGFYYVCVATIESVKLYQILKRVHLNVESSQMIESTLNETALVYKNNDHEDVMEGEYVSIFCIFDGKPNPKVTWTKDGSIDYIVRRFLFGFSFLGNKISFFNLRARRNDSGVYSCESPSLNSGENQTHSFNLTVNVPPIFIVKPKDQHLNKGDTATFKCQADGAPDVSTKWTYNGKPIEANSHITIEPNAMVIENVTLSDIGNYGCNCSNAVGYIYADVYLNVAKPSPPLFTPETTTTGVK